MTFYLLWFVGCCSMTVRKGSTLSILPLRTCLSLFHLLWYIYVISLPFPYTSKHILPPFIYLFVCLLVYLFIFPQIHVFYSHQFLPSWSPYSFFCTLGPSCSSYLVLTLEKSLSDFSRWSPGISSWLCPTECMMSVREMQLKSLCLFVWWQSETVSQNLYHQSGTPELLFEFDLLLKSHWATCMLARAVKGDETIRSVPSFQSPKKEAWEWICGSLERQVQKSLLLIGLCVASAAERCFLCSNDGLWSGGVMFICTPKACAIGLGEMRSYVVFISRICSIKLPGSLLVSLNAEVCLFCRCFFKIMFHCEEQILTCGVSVCLFVFLNATFIFGII